MVEKFLKEKPQKFTSIERVGEEIIAAKRHQQNRQDNLADQRKKKCAVRVRPENAKKHVDQVTKSFKAQKLEPQIVFPQQGKQMKL